ncbi:MAG: amidohydrolase family protein [Sneathiellaceae bacterium]
MQEQAAIIVNGRVRQSAGGESAAPQAEAVAVRDGRIAGLGSEAEMQALAGPAARRIDAQGAVVMPGLIDAHPHLLHFAAREYGMVHLFDARNHDDIVERIRAHAARTPKGQWIVCTPVGEPHYFIRRSWRDLPERRLPDRHVLDRATTDHPVHIQAWAPTTPNVCAFNSAGLAAVGLSSFIAERVCDVWIEKDDDGDITGILRGAVNNYYTFDPFWTQLLLKMPGPASWELHDSVIQAMAGYNAQGVTTVYEGHNMRDSHIDAYRRLHGEGKLSVRVMAAMEAESYAYPPVRPLTLEAFMSTLQAGLRLMGQDDEMLKVTGMSYSPAAPMGPGTIRMHEPYLDGFGRPTRGVTVLTNDKLEAFVEFCAANGLRGNFCVAGDRDTDDVLAALTVADGRHGIRERRWMMQHCLVVTPAQVERIRDLGCDVTSCPGFAWGKGDVYAERAGEMVLRDMVPLKRILKAGIPLGCGSDWGPKNPWENIALSTTFEFAGSGRRNDSADHALTRAESLHSWTAGAADVLGWQGTGSLAAGSHADLILVDRDPLDCRVEDLPGTRVHLTMLGGKIVHDEGVAG